MINKTDPLVVCDDDYEALMLFYFDHPATENEIIKLFDNVWPGKLSELNSTLSQSEIFEHLITQDILSSISPYSRVCSPDILSALRDKCLEFNKKFENMLSLIIFIDKDGSVEPGAIFMNQELILSKPMGALATEKIEGLDQDLYTIYNNMSSAFEPNCEYRSFYLPQPRNGDIRNLGRCLGLSEGVFCNPYPVNTVSMEQSKNAHKLRKSNFNPSVLD